MFESRVETPRALIKFQKESKMKSKFMHSHFHLSNVRSGAGYGHNAVVNSI